MERRTFVKIVGAGSAGVLLSAALEGCEGQPSRALEAWDGPLDLHEGADIRLKIISYAILAPNAHNTQPWIIDLRKEGIGLWVDPARLLPQTDPAARQIMITQGTFLETLTIAATHYGLKAAVALFPDGMDPLESIGKNPVAHVSLTEAKEGQEDPLFPFITRRHTNRRAYSGPPLSEQEIAAFPQVINDDQFPLRIVSDSAAIERIASMMTEAMRIETYNHAMHAETVRMLRFTDEEVENRRDGIGFPNLGITGVKLFFARLFAGRNSAFDESFLERTVESIREGAHSARAIGLLCSRGVGRGDEIMTGRYFMRLFLTATRLGLSLQPMSQVMEIDSVKTEFTKFMDLQDEPQMLFRIGRSAPTPHSPRRKLGDFLKS